MRRDKISYKSTGNTTAEVVVNGQKVSIRSFEMKHDINGAPSVTMEFVDPDIDIDLTMLDSNVVRKKREFEERGVKTCNTTSL